MAMRTKTRNFNPRAPCGARPTGTKQAKDLFEISTHAPLAGRDSRSWSNASLLAGFQPTRPLRGATVFGAVVLRMLIHFNPRAPCGARRAGYQQDPLEVKISTHAPLAGRDDLDAKAADSQPEISTHAPLAGRDGFVLRGLWDGGISTHAPLAGRDEQVISKTPSK